LDIRPVMRHTRDELGRIAFLFGGWGAVAAATAIEQIRVGACSYFVELSDGGVATFEPVDHGGGTELALFTTAGDPVCATERGFGRMGP
jgi:hypothetical protein